MLVEVALRLKCKSTKCTWIWSLVGVRPNVLLQHWWLCAIELTIGTNVATRRRAWTGCWHTRSGCGGDLLTWIRWLCRSANYHKASTVRRLTVDDDLVLMGWYLVPVIGRLEITVVIAERRNGHELTAARDRRDQKTRRVLIVQLMIGTLMHEVLIINIDYIFHQLFLFLGR